MSRIVRIEIDLDKNKTRTFVNEDMPEQQKKDILNYINKEGKYNLNRIVKGISNMDKKRKEEERVVKGFKVIKGNKKWGVILWKEYTE